MMTLPLLVQLHPTRWKIFLMLDKTALSIRSAFYNSKSIVPTVIVLSVISPLPNVVPGPTIATPNLAYLYGKWNERRNDKSENEKQVLLRLA
jgi:hypothetical protein